MQKPRPGPTEEIRFTIRDTALGRMLVARSANGLCAVFFGEEDVVLEEALRRRFPAARVLTGGEAGDALANGVAALVENPSGTFDTPLDLRGTELQRSVWSVLRSIRSGERLTYTELAHRVGRPRSVRAVAQACAANALAVVVPCHRVVRGDGGLAGYRWGVERKRRLLEMETNLPLQITPSSPG